MRTRAQRKKYSAVSPSPIDINLSWSACEAHTTDKMCKNLPLGSLLTRDKIYKK